jgi:hypothetical protein
MVGQPRRRSDPKGTKRKGRRHPASADPCAESGFGECPVRPSVIALCAVAFAVLGLVLLYALWQFWPPTLAVDAKVKPFYQFRFLWWTFFISREKNLLVIVAISGALGAMIYVVRSFFRYVGERNLRYSWLLSYFLSPLAGGILATAVYIVLRAGLISGGGTTPDPFGFAATGVLVGMFVQQAAEKMKMVFESLFAPAPTSSEPIAEDAAKAPIKGDVGGVERGSVESLGLVGESDEELEPDMSPEAAAEANLTEGQTPENHEDESASGSNGSGGRPADPVEDPELIDQTDEVLKPDTSPEAGADADLTEGQAPEHNEGQ